jgi:peptidoglycan hydrolase-like protein with peptidoglycan-binding domain
MAGMVKSQNGYSANDTSVIAGYTIPYSHERISLRKGSAGVVLLDLLGYIHQEVVNFDQATLDEWGTAFRAIRDSVEISNHASGTAFDVDARKHPLGASGTWSALQVAKIEARLALYNRLAGTQVVRWGRNYHGRKDEMHFEIVAGPAAVVKVATYIRQGRLGGGAYSYLVGRARFRATVITRHPAVYKSNPYGEPSYVVKRDDKAKPRKGVQWVQWALSFSTQDGRFGPHTEAAVRSFQHAHGLLVDGVVGDHTKYYLRRVKR